MEELEDVAEAIEGAALGSFYYYVSSVGVKTRTARDGRVLALCMDGTSDPMLNRVFELGLGVPATREGVETLLARFHEHEAPS